MALAEPTWTVLVADDNDEFLEAARAWMASRTEFEVIGVAENGERALERVAMLDPDLVLMDAMMPVLDGFGATRRLRESGDRRWVVIASFHDSQAVRHEAWASGADGFVSKSELTAALPDLLRGLARAREAEGDDGPTGPSRPSAPAAEEERPPVERGPIERGDAASRLAQDLKRYVSKGPAGEVPDPE